MMRKRLSFKRSWFLLAIISSLWILMSGHQESVTGSPVYGDPTIIISFPPDELITSFDEGVNSVTVRCNVDCQYPEGAPRGSTVMVTLNLVDDLNFIETKSWIFIKDDPPHMMEFNYQMTGNLKAGSKVPIRISGFWEYQTADGHGQIALISKEVTLGEYGRVRILRHGQASDIKLKPGDWYEVTVRISNLGNVDCLIELDYPSLPHDLQIESERSSIMVDAFHEEIIPIRFRLKGDSDIDDEISIRVATVVSGNTYIDTLVLPVRSKVEEEETAPTIGPIPILITALFIIAFFTAMIIFWTRLRFFQEKEEKVITDAMTRTTQNRSLEPGKR